MAFRACVLLQSSFFFFLLKKEKDKIVSYLSSHPVSIVKENILQYLKK